MFWKGGVVQFLPMGAERGEKKRCGRGGKVRVKQEGRKGLWEKEFTTR